MILRLAAQMNLLFKTCSRCLQNSQQHDIYTILLLMLISIVPSVLDTIISKLLPQSNVTQSDKHGVTYDGSSEAPDYSEILDLYQGLAADDKRCEVLLFDLKDWIKCKWLGAHSKVRQHMLTQPPPESNRRFTVTRVINSSLIVISKVSCTIIAFSRL